MAAAVAINNLLYIVHQDPHAPLRVTPAMMAGVTTGLFDVMDLDNPLIESESAEAALVCRQP